MKSLHELNNNSLYWSPNSHDYDLVSLSNDLFGTLKFDKPLSFSFPLGRKAHAVAESTERKWDFYIEGFFHQLIKIRPFGSDTDHGIFYLPAEPQTVLPGLHPHGKLLQMGQPELIWRREKTNEWIC